MATYIPWELRSLILVHLDRSQHAACSLISRDWRNVSQFHLFHSITTDLYNIRFDITAFITFLDAVQLTHPDIPRSIKNVTVRGKTRSNSRAVRVETSVDSVSEMVARLPSLQSVEFHYVQLGYPRSSRSLPSPIPLRRLTLNVFGFLVPFGDGVAAHAPSPAHDLFALFSSIDFLSLSNVYISESTITSSPSVPGLRSSQASPEVDLPLRRIPVHRLACDGVEICGPATAQRRIFEYLSHSHPLEVIGTLDILDSPKEMRALGTALGDSVAHLHLRLQGGGTQSAEEQVWDVTKHCKALTALHITVVAFRQGVGLRQVLALIENAPETVSTLTVTWDCNFFLSSDLLDDLTSLLLAEDWHAFDSHLFDRRDNLQKVVIRFMDVSGADVSPLPVDSPFKAPLRPVLEKLPLTQSTDRLEWQL
ncbi:hypothetical protein EIP91_011324 [Steccherinum ochraceum]|uniref:F-box domain-containing protein n=1 Tax=Steccherinum ochraceum TaxID=92696 RepID=A0A4R0QZS6_9APHY|nr:hypothetical protein EIP91_011324 [Steccherinum ochraceum]